MKNYLVRMSRAPRTKSPKLEAGNAHKGGQFYSRWWGFLFWWGADVKKSFREEVYIVFAAHRRVAGARSMETVCQR